MENQQSEVLKTASEIELAITCGFIGSAAQYQHLLLSAVSQLRRLHARVGELESVAADHIAQDRKMVAAPMVLPEPIGYAHQGQLDNISDGYAYVYPMESPSTSCKMYTEQQVRDLLAKATCTKSQTGAQEPFGYFKAEPFGWRDCAETDEGAIALYEAPQPQADARDAQRYHWLIDYFVSDRDDLDDAIVAARTSEALSKVIDTAIAAAKGEL